MPIPSGTINKKAYSHTQRAAQMGGRATLAKYGKIPVDPEMRKKAWFEWWNGLSEDERVRRYPRYCAREVVRPAKNELLAEFIGIILGDGGISKYQICISLGSKTDRAYVKVIVEIIKRLFGVKPTTSETKKENVINIVISRKKIVEFLLSNGLVIGNKVKQQVGVPSWIIQNRRYALACVRGLMDTDGCIFRETHFYKNKAYSYPRMSFVNHSIPLCSFMFEVLRKAGIMARFRSNRAVTIELPNDVRKYKCIVGFNNPKHAERYRRFTGGVR
ncbi:MAG: hypothetical protein V1895_03930 [Parcubacteria group bacterium]